MPSDLMGHLQITIQRSRAAMERSKACRRRAEELTIQTRRLIARFAKIRQAYALAREQAHKRQLSISLGSVRYKRPSDPTRN